MTWALIYDSRPCAHLTTMTLGTHQYSPLILICARISSFSLRLVYSWIVRCNAQHTIQKLLSCLL